MDAPQRKRQTQSCDRCKFKKRRCDGLQPCSNCTKAEADCTMLIEQKKRGPKRPDQDGSVKKVRVETTKVERSSLGDEESVERLERVEKLEKTINDMRLQRGEKLVQAERVLDFDADFAFNFGLDIPLDQLKPSSFNPPSLFTNQPLDIDPEVLNLYTQLNPKLTIQNDLDLFLSSTLGTNHIPTDDSFLYGATNLTIPELPGIPTTFYMHLISMFFTYYHPNMPLIQEKVFLENLVPTNKHHPMLLNTIYAIGSHYSRSPYLYQSPFYTPQKAVDYFISRALAATPAPENWGLISSNSIAISQASLLLSSCDFQTKKSHTWMMIGMAIRLNQKFEMYQDKSTHDFLSLVNGVQKFQVDCTAEERKRVWFGSMLADLFLCLSTGSPLMINEADYIHTVMSSVSCVSSKDPTNIQSQSNTRSQLKDQGDADKWMPYFSGFPKDTIFGASDVNSELWGRQSLGFFQVGHLFSRLDDIVHVMQLSFITRRAIRFTIAHPKSNSPLYALLPKVCQEGILIHDSLILWYESLPLQFRMWQSLEVLVSDNFTDLTTYCTLTDGKRLSSVAVLLNLLFFSTLATLHQHLHTIKLESEYRVASSLLFRKTFESSDIARLAYRGQVYLLRRVYGQSMPPQPTTIPPSEIVASSMIACLLMPTAVALLEHSDFSLKLLEKYHPNSYIPIHEQQDSTGIDSLESVFLPVLENIGQVWPVAHSYAKILRNICENVSKKGFEGTTIIY